MNLTAYETDSTLRSLDHFEHFDLLFDLFILNSALCQSFPANLSLIISASVSFQYSAVLIMSSRFTQSVLHKSFRLFRASHPGS